MRDLERACTTAMVRYCKVDGSATDGAMKTSLADVRAQAAILLSQALVDLDRRMVDVDRRAGGNAPAPSRSDDPPKPSG